MFDFITEETEKFIIKKNEPNSGRKSYLTKHNFINYVVINSLLNSIVLFWSSLSKSGSSLSRSGTFTKSKFELIDRFFWKNFEKGVTGYVHIKSIIFRGINIATRSWWGDFSVRTTFPLSWTTVLFLVFLARHAWSHWRKIFYIIIIFNYQTPIFWTIY